jgi:hypothetical protein
MALPFIGRWIKKHHMYWDYVIWLGSLNELWMQNELDYDLPKKLKLLRIYIVQMAYVIKLSFIL